MTGRQQLDAAAKDAMISDLLEALEGMLQVHGVYQRQADLGIVNQSEVELSKMARAAVAKAKGAQP